jgi:hypothetical protein
MEEVGGEVECRVGVTADAGAGYPINRRAGRIFNGMQRSLDVPSCLR